MKDYDLERFVTAQNKNRESYAVALSEIKAGQKQTHWIWYIFPQLMELGYSQRAKDYGITDIDEAKLYLAHPVLGERLREISQALLDLESDDANYVMHGYPDDLKLRSSMTLFAQVSEEGSVFHKVLEKFFDGKQDDETIKLLKKSAKS
ncbi:MAG: DUF1810 domain-containing protein [Synergistaceae bacterium]|nr:DUF1810 domain-containing protein [Synergistaceae bacterium]